MRGHDVLVEGFRPGVIDLIGEPDRDPAISFNVIADYAGASMHGFAGVLLTLLARGRMGRGQLMDVSYLDTTISLLADAGANGATTPPCRAPSLGAVWRLRFIEGSALDGHWTRSLLDKGAGPE